MSGKIKLSVIIPVYNLEKYIERCLDSLTSQIDDEMEIIVVDDGSTDDSLNICKKYKKSRNIMVFSQENQGVSAARNKGLELASGQYVIFIDGDDWIQKSSLQKVMKIIDGQSPDVIVLGFSVDYENGEVINFFDGSNRILTDKGEILEALLNPWSVCGKVYKREILNHIQFDNCKIAEDLLFNCRVYETKKINSCYVFSTDFYHYFQRGTSAMHSNYSNKYLDSLKIEIDVAMLIFGDRLKNSKIPLISNGINVFLDSFSTMSLRKQKEHKRDYLLYKKLIKENKHLIVFSNMNAMQYIKLVCKIRFPKLYIFIRNLKNNMFTSKSECN